MTDQKITNIVLAGVGGQGILLASKVLAEAAVIEGYDVKSNEVHGMAQRGGNVICQVRFGDKVFSPLVKKGSADILVAMEITEALRYCGYAAPDGRIFVNTQRVIPTTVSSGQAAYPADPEKLVRETYADPKLADCLSIAIKAGSAKCVNTVMCGWISPHLPFSEDTWRKVLESSVPTRFLAVNLRAFELGKGLNG